MNRMLSTNAFTRIAAAAILAAGVFTTNVAQAYERWVWIANEGREAIYYVHITHVDDTSWGRDLLGRDVIMVGDSLMVEPRRHQGYCRFDVKIVYASGREVIRENVNLCEAYRIEVDGRRAQVYYV